MSVVGRLPVLATAAVIIRTKETWTTNVLLLKTMFIDVTSAKIRWVILCQAWSFTVAVLRGIGKDFIPIPNSMYSNRWRALIWTSCWQPCKESPEILRQRPAQISCRISTNVKGDRGLKRSHGYLVVFAVYFRNDEDQGKARERHNRKSPRQHEHEHANSDRLDRTSQEYIHIQTDCVTHRGGVGG